MKDNNRIVSESKLNIIAQALKNALLNDFEYVSVDEDIDDGISVIVSSDDVIDVIEYVDFEDINYIMESPSNARKFYRGLVSRLKTQHIKIVDLKENFTTPTNLENIKKTDFLLTLEKDFEDISNGKYVGKDYDSGYHRMLGKTTSLAYLSMKYNVPILVSKAYMKKFIERDFPEAEIITFSDFKRGGLDKDIFLIDELSFDEFYEVQRHGVKYLGFVRY